MPDVVVVGGGPAGSSCAGFIKKYNPSIDVLVLEREKFPREHVGESLLPPVASLLNELGCWEKIEAADFPIKIGATYRWGRTPELWDFVFFPADKFVDEPRPAKYQGQRLSTAFQVERAIYDKILLDHAAELGATVREETKITEILKEGDKITGVKTDSGELIQASYYIDCSGHSGIIRRNMGVDIEEPTSLQNVAFWDYWQNAEWAVEIGVGATRVQVISVGIGWIWFIPLGPTKTSVGLVMPRSTFQESGLKPRDIYLQTLQNEPLIWRLMSNAVSEDDFHSTKDWSFVAERHCGDNWFLCGEASGFADPILAAGLTISQYSAKECAFTLLELLKTDRRKQWLLEQYNSRQHTRIRGHIRFADYWYSANSQFSDLKDYTSKIAEESGLDLKPDQAWAWLAQGGFIDSDENMGLAGFAVPQLRALSEFLTEVETEGLFKRFNSFVLNLDGAETVERAQYANGKVLSSNCYCRGKRVLPETGPFKFVIDVLTEGRTTRQISDALSRIFALRRNDPAFVKDVLGRFPSAFEAMISDGWITASFDPDSPLMELPFNAHTGIVLNQDTALDMR